MPSMHPPRPTAHALESASSSRAQRTASDCATNQAAHASSAPAIPASSSSAAAAMATQRSETGPATESAQSVAAGPESGQLGAQSATQAASGSLPRSDTKSASSPRIRSADMQSQQATAEDVDDEACFVDPDRPKVDFLALLPFELALYVLYHLPSHRDLIRASAVCRTWRTVATDNVVWRERFFRNPGWAIRSDAELVLRRQHEKHKKAAALSAKRRQDKLREVEQRRQASTSRLSSLRSWRESLHIPSLPDLSSLSLTASASLSIGGSSSLSYSAKTAARDAPEGTSAPPLASPSREASSSRFGFLPSPARGPLTPAGRRRAQRSAPSDGAVVADANAVSLVNRAGADDDAAAASRTTSDDVVRDEDLLSSLDWRILFRDRHILDQRWRRCREPGASKATGGRSRLSSSPRAFEPSRRILLGHKDGVYCVRHDTGIGSGTEGRIVSGSRDRTIRVWDTETAKCRHIIKGHAASVLSLHYDERILVTGSSDGSVFVWDFAGILATTTTTRQHGDEDASFDGKKAAIVGPSAPADPQRGDGSSSSTSTAEEGDDDDGDDDNNDDGGGDDDGAGGHGSTKPLRHGTERVVARLRGHTMGVLDVTFDDEWIVSCSKDSTVRVWKRGEGYDFHRRYAGHSGPVNAARIQDKRVVSAAGDGSVHLWAVASCETLRVFSGHERGLACVAFSGNTVISGSNDQTIRAWDAERGTCVGIYEGHEHLVRAVAYDGPRRLIVSGGYDKRIKVWDADVPDKPLREIRPHVARIFDVEFDCTRIVSASEDQSICITSFGGAGIDTSLFA
ncbi:uncharacterized protein PFL1_05021 [Pseudozyma flocculosa PF-1]|uniref:F-box domain-containing protein n=1 Tax=Pseudozyma flocculosa PF-1 TaxID=1277687 RepID=A0A061H4H3_9BASI|nr:uncharacterized protein PFL1_05021 [Pseudozyma flocculosa PF-1]EPQ27483.1 hypothetical protein PFL1_05021 [Pseudozyma flocculosa PF-1]